MRDDGGCIYGQRDLPCDCSETHVFDAVARVPPHKALWVTSNLTRAKQTAEAIFKAGHPDAKGNAPIRWPNSPNSISATGRVSTARNSSAM